MQRQRVPNAKYGVKRLSALDGLTLAGIGALAVAWLLPARVALPGALLLMGPLLLRFVRQGTAGLLWRAYGWAWAWSCWLAAPPGVLRFFAICMLLLGILADWLRGKQEHAATPQRRAELALAVLTSAIFLIGMRIAAFGFTPSAGSAPLWEWVVLGGGLYIGATSAGAALEKIKKMRFHGALPTAPVAIAIACLALAGPNQQPVSPLPNRNDFPQAAPPADLTLPLLVNNTIKERAAVVFGNSVACLGAEVLPAAGLSPGDKLVLHLTWAWESQPGRDWRVFIHARRNLYGGAMYDVSAGLPEGEGNVPCHQELEIAMPPDAPLGEYMVIIGLWNGRNNAPAERGGDCPANWAVDRFGRVRVARATLVPGETP